MIGLGGRARAAMEVDMPDDPFVIQHCDLALKDIGISRLDIRAAIRSGADLGSTLK